MATRQQPSKSAATVEALRATLRNAQLRATAPRVAVLRALRAATGPVSHPELVEALSGEGWDRATIYRNLVDLTEAGLARRTDLGDHVWRFELENRHAPASHPHFVCDACGGVQCLPLDTITLRRTRGAPRSLERKRVEIQLRGRCDRCG